MLCRLGVIIVDEIYPKRHFFCTRPMYPYQHDLPPWKTVYYHFRRWEKRGVLAQIRDALVKKARAQAGKDAPKHLAVDSQSVPSTAKGGHAGMTGARK